VGERQWRVLTDAAGGATPPLPADDIATRLWAMDGELLWAEPVDGGEGAFPQDLPEVRELLLADPARVAKAWLQYVPRPRWLFEWVMHVCGNEPDGGWSIVQALVAAAKDDEDLALVAAGPLEELLRTHGSSVVERVEQLAQHDRRFRRALSGVWRSTIDQAIWSRVLNAVGDEPGLDG